MSSKSSTCDQVATYYKEKMTGYLNRDRLPPTEYELRQKDAQVRREAMSRYRSDDEGRAQKSFASEFKNIQVSFKEKRHEMLIEAVLGTKNYVPQIN